MSKTKKIISLLLTVALIMTIATVAIVSASAATTVYFENSNGWATVKAYVFGGTAGEALGGWSGTACNDLGNGVWSIDIPEDCEAVIFNDGNGNQTANLANPGGSMIAKLTGEKEPGEYNEVDSAVWEAYAGEDTPADTGSQGGEDAPVSGDTVKVYFSDDSNWGGICAYAWDANEVKYLGEWPGSACTDEGNGVWSIDLPAEATNVIFNGGDGAPQTADLNNPGQTMIAKLTGETVPGEFGGENFVAEWEAYGEAPATTAPAETTAAPAETTAAPAETTAAPAETTAAPAETTAAPAETTAAAVEGTGIVVAGTTYDAAVGTTVTYKVDLTAARLFENVQAFVTYDGTKLQLVRITSDDPDVEDWEVEGPVRCPNLDGVIFNAGAENIVKFNASKVAGYNFKDGANLVNLEFKVLSEDKTEVALTIEELTIKGGEESYFENGVASVTDGITVTEYLVVEAPVTTAAPVETTAAPVETTAAPVETTAAPVETTAAPVETTAAPVETTAAPAETTAAPAETTVPAPATDPTSTQGTTAGTDSDPVKTGAAAYIYVVLAILAMAACAVVVLRKKVNG